MDLAALRERIAGRVIIASVSGGKDSAAMCLHLREMGLPFEPVFLDTGWEHAATYEYLRGELARVIGPVRELKPERQFATLVEHKQMFPSRVMRFCTQELKVYPMQRYLRALVNDGADVLNAVGIRRAESRARSEMTEWEWSSGFDCEVWRPLVEWSEQDVIDIHKRHGLQPNPLYLLGARRVGCWPCIFASKEEIRFLVEHDPGRVAEIRALEAHVNAMSDERAARLGRPIDAGRHLFQLRRRVNGKNTNYRAPIDEVALWARTARGGKQFDAFAPSPPDAGCMRWGLCETASAEASLRDLIDPALAALDEEPDRG